MTIEAIKELLDDFIEAERQAFEAVFRPDLEAQHAKVDQMRSFLSTDCRDHGFVGQILPEGQPLEFPFKGKVLELQSADYYEKYGDRKITPRVVFRVDTFKADDGVRYGCFLSKLNKAPDGYSEVLILGEREGRLCIEAVAKLRPPRYADDPIDDDNCPHWDYVGGDPDRYRKQEGIGSMDFGKLGDMVASTKLRAPKDEMSLLYHEGEIVGF